MASLAELTDMYSDPMGASPLPVEPIIEPNPHRRVPVYKSEETDEESPLDVWAKNRNHQSSPLSNNVDKILNSLFRDDDQRLQLWPEKVVRNAIKTVGGVNSGEIPTNVVDPHTGEVHTNPKLIEGAMDIATFAGTGGLAGTSAGGVALGAGPFLRPALKHKERLYKGKEGQQHQDIIPESLYNDFQKKAMSGDDLAEYNFGFINDKGQFLSREKALEYGINTGIIDPHAGKYGALTSTLMADSSKPGVAIEAMGKTGAVDPIHFKSTEAAKFRLGQLERDKAASKKAGVDVNSSDYMFYNTQIRELKDFIKNPEEFKLKADSSKEGAALQATKDWKIKGFEDYNDWFHGTTHELNKFSKAKGNPENYLGKSPHFTNSSKDASANYAGMGPDLTQRIELRAEELAQKIADKKYNGEMGDNYGKIMTAAKDKAKEELMGSHEGAIIPANLKFENPISTVEHRPTWLDFAAKYNDEGDLIKEAPLLLKLHKSLEKQAEKYDFDPKKVMEDLGDNLYDEVKASTFDKALRNSEALTYAEDRKTGKLVSSDIIANIYKDMGFDGIVMDAKAAFPHMKDIPAGTLHAAPLKRNTVQSKITGQTLFADSSKPAAGVEAMGKTAPKLKLKKEGENRFFINDENGKELGRLAVDYADGDLNIVNVTSPQGPNSFGPSAVRDLLPQLLEHYPNTKVIGGFRAGGARAKNNSTNKVVEYKLRPVDYEPEFN